MELFMHESRQECFCTNAVMQQRRLFQDFGVEKTFYRYKTVIGRKLRARAEKAREVEVILACNILNRCLELGRPDSVCVG